MSLESISFPNLLNARDLGGYSTQDGQATRWKAFVRTDDLSQLTPEGIQAIRTYGIRTVIDLRWAAEIEKYPNPFQPTESGVHYHHISLLSPTEAEWMKHRPVTKEQWNCIVLEVAQPELRTVLTTIANAPKGGVLFHCMAGKDRTGVIASLLLALADVEPEIIAYDYCLSTDNLRDAELAKEPEDKHPEVLARLYCPPEQIHNMLAYMADHHGGVEGYVKEIGVTDEDVERIRARLR